MQTSGNIVKRYPQVTFWGFAWTTWIVGWYLATLYPSELWFFALYTPFLGGVLVTALADGRSGLKTFFGRMFRWRVGIQWYLVALFLPVLIRLGAAGLNMLLGAEVAADFQLPPWSEILLTFIFPSFFLVALGEEPGFRGFALPRLLVGRSALAAALVLGVLHAIWHIPLLIFDSAPPLLLVIVICGSVLNTWLFIHTGGSVLLAMILHASIDVMAMIFNPLFTGADAERYFLMQVVVFLALAVLLPLLTGLNLGRKKEATALPVSEQPVAVK